MYWMEQGRRQLIEYEVDVGTFNMLPLVAAHLILIAGSWVSAIEELSSLSLFPCQLDQACMSSSPKFQSRRLLAVFQFKNISWGSISFGPISNSTR